MENTLLQIIKDMKSLLLKASSSLEGEDQRTADDIDIFLQNLDSNIKNAKKNQNNKIIDDLSNLDTYTMQIVDKSELDGPEIKPIKNNLGNYILLNDVRNVIEKYKNNDFFKMQDLFNAFSHYAFESISNKPYNESELIDHFDNWYQTNYKNN